MDKKLQAIHNSLVNGQRRQMCDQIDEYGLYDFWSDYRDWLNIQAEKYNAPLQTSWFEDAVISYHRIRHGYNTVLQGR